MQLGKGTQGSHLFVDNRIIFHGARTKRIKPVVNTKIVGAVIGVVAHHSELIALRKSSVLGTAKMLGDIGC